MIFFLFFYHTLQYEKLTPPFIQTFYSFYKYRRQQVREEEREEAREEKREGRREGGRISPFTLLSLSTNWSGSTLTSHPWWTVHRISRPGISLGHHLPWSSHCGLACPAVVGQVPSHESPKNSQFDDSHSCYYQKDVLHLEVILPITIIFLFQLWSLWHHKKIKASCHIRLNMFW